jgi:glycosyltransferase involved in cell wall biosynthesis
MTNINDYQVTVIIPTLAEPQRRDSLLRTIDSILKQQGVKALPIVVINGQRFDRDLRKMLESRNDIKMLYLPEGHVAKAQALGVEHVGTAYFAFLDDDDLFTEDALAHRLALMEGSPPPDFVVTNIYVEKHGKKSLLAEEFNEFSTEPQHSIFKLAWLHSINNLFRTATIGVEYFKNRDRYMEWTALGIRLAKNKRAAFSNKPTAVYHDTSASASKQYSYLEAEAKLMASLPRRQFPWKTRRLINRKYSAALNGLSQHAHAEGKIAEAWHFHLECLMIPGGWRYLSYTRKLIWPKRR